MISGSITACFDIKKREKIRKISLFSNTFAVAGLYFLSSLHVPRCKESLHFHFILMPIMFDPRMAAFIALHKYGI